RRGREVEKVPWACISRVEVERQKRRYYLVSSGGPPWALDLAYSPGLPAFHDALFQECPRRSGPWGFILAASWGGGAGLKGPCGNSGPPVLDRRDLLRRAGLGFGTIALAGLLQEDGLLEGAAPPARPKARSVVFLFMGGGPSQVDTFDPKPELNRLAGQPVPESIARG